MNIRVYFCIFLFFFSASCWLSAQHFWPSYELVVTRNEKQVPLGPRSKIFLYEEDSAGAFVTPLEMDSDGGFHFPPFRTDSAWFVFRRGKMFLDVKIFEEEIWHKWGRIDLEIYERESECVDDVESNEELSSFRFFFDFKWRDGEEFSLDSFLVQTWMCFPKKYFSDWKERLAKAQWEEEW